MLARSGGDPLADKRRAEGVPTFAESAQRVLEQKQGGWRGRWHAQNWWRSMERRCAMTVKYCTCGAYSTSPRWSPSFRPSS